MKKDLPIIVITGPSASGKTKFAINLAKRINAEIICADSRTVYKNFDIVSAKPTLNEQKEICHHLLSIIDANQTFSAGDFVLYAKKAIEEIKLKGKNVIIAGGTWFYIKALLGDKMLPEIKADERKRQELSNFKSAVLWEKLLTLDKDRALQINKNNKDKIIRSIEMCEFLGAPISSFKRKENDFYKSVWFAPEIEREEIYKRIGNRVDSMIVQGVENEFKALIEKFGRENKVIKNTIGYSEFLQYNERHVAIDKIKQHTRNFAKRQITYFKSNKNIRFIDFSKEFPLELLQDI